MKRNHGSLSANVVRLIAGAAIVVCCGRLPVEAASYTWSATGTSSAIGGSGTWDTSALLWTTDGSTWSAWNNANVDTAVFAGTAGSVTLGGPITAGGLTFNTTGYSIIGDTLTLAGGTANITTGGGVSASIASTVSGSAVFTKLGSGILALTGANTYSGDTIVSEGKLILGGTAGTAAGTGNLTIALSSGWDVYSSTGVDLASDQTLGLVTFNGSDYSGLRPNGHTVTVAGLSDATGKGVIENAGISQASITSNGSLSLNVAAGGNYSFNGWLRDNDATGSTTLSVAKAGAGTQTLVGGYIYYTGATTITSGTLALQDTTAFASTVAVSSGATLALRSNAAMSFASVVGGSGSVTKLGASTVTLTGANTYSGETIVSEGKLILGGTAGTAAGTGNLTITVSSGWADSANGVDLASNQTLGVVTFNGSTFGGLRPNGHTATVAGLSDSTGLGVIENAGRTQAGVTSNGSLSLNVAAGGNYSFNGWLRDNDATGSTTLSVAKVGAGTQTLVGGNVNYTGATTITSGTLALQDTTAFASTVAVSSGATLALRSNAAMSFASVVGGSGSVTKLGASTVTLTGANTYSGETIVREGKLILGGTAGTATGTGNLSISESSGWDNSSNGVDLASNQTLGVVTFNGSSYAALRPNGYTATIAGLSDSTGLGVIENAGLTQTGVTANGSLSVNVAAGGNYSFNGFFRDNDATGSTTLSVAKAGAGTQTLVGGYIYYTGATTINGGTLALQNTTAFSSNIAVGSGGALTLNNTANGFANRYSGWITRQISGSGTLNITSGSSGIDGGWVTFYQSYAGLNNFTGTVNVNSGVLTMDNLVGAWSGNPTLNVYAGGLFGIRGQDISVDGLNGNGDVMNGWTGDTGGHTLTVGAAGGSGTFSGVIHGSSTGGADGTIDQGILGLTKTGAGTQVLTGANTYTGPTTINGGVLQIGNGGTTGSLSPSSSIVNNGSLVFARSNAITQGADFAAGISGTGSLVHNGSGNVILTGVNTYSGGTVLNSGTLTLAGVDLGGNSYVGNGTLTINAGATLATSGGNNPFGVNDSRTPETLNVNGGTIDAGNYIQFLSLAMTDGLMKTTAGWVSGSNVTINPSTSTGSLITGGDFYLRFGADFTASGTKTFTVNRGTASADLTISSSLVDPLGSGGGPIAGIIKAGNGVMALTGANTYTGPTTINGGLLQIGNGGTTGSLSPSSAIVNNGSLVFNRSNAITQGADFAAGISGTGSLIQNGSGNVTLAGDNSYSGGTVVNSGTLTLTGVDWTGSKVGNGTLTINSGATLVTYAGNPLGGNDSGTPGTLNVNGGTIAASKYVQFLSLVMTDGSMSVASNAGWVSGSNVTINPSTSTGSFITGGDFYLRFGADYNVSGTKTFTVSRGTASADLTISSNLVDPPGSGGGAIAGIVKAGNGIMVLAGANTFSGATSITGGRLEIAPTGQVNSTSGITINGATAELKYNSATALTRPITLTAGTISGTGSIATPMTVAAGGVLSPGNSPGTQAYSQGLAWSGGGSYLWELNSLSGTAGANWDLLAVSGSTFDLSGLSAGNPFTLDLNTLTAGNLPGSLAVPYDGGSYSFLIASYSSLTTPLGSAPLTDLTSLFTVQLGGWADPKPNLGDVSVRINAAANGLELVIVPEPDALTIAGIGIAVAAWTAGRRRRAA